MPSERIAVIGGGRMGEAIVAGLITAGSVSADEIVVAEPAAARAAVFEARGVAVLADAHEAVPGATIVILAVKPQIIEAVTAHLAPQLPPDAVAVSIAAGVSCARLEAVLPAGTRVVRVMPNTPALVGEGMSVLSAGTRADAATVERVRALFETLGETVVLDERYQDAAAAISGCGPAYVALVVDSLARAGVRQGLTRDVAQALALQTLRGTVALIEQTASHPEAIIDAVTSPGGTTIAAIEALEAGGVRSAFYDAVDAAVRRSRELGS